MTPVMQARTDWDTPRGDSLATATGEIFAGAFFGGVLAALLVILRDGTPTAGVEILGGAILFGGLGMIRASRRGESARILWNESRARLTQAGAELSFYLRATSEKLRSADEWAKQRVRRLADSRSS